MNDQHRNTLLALGIAVGLISIPLTWFTADAVQVGGRLQVLFLETIESAIGEVNQVEVTGWEGEIDFPVKTPLWMIVCIALGAGALQLMRNSEMFDIPGPVLWLSALVACAWIAGTFIYVLSTGRAELGIGASLGLASGVIPLLCLVVPATKDTESVPR